MNKARIAFDGAREVATGHWGCGAYGNNHDLMFLKQWLAASEAGVEKVYYHDFDRNQSHHIFPLIRKLRHMTVGQLWEFVLRDLTGLGSHNAAEFAKCVADVATGKQQVPTGAAGAGAGADARDGAVGDASAVGATTPAPVPALLVPEAETETVEEVGEGHQHAVYPLQVLQTSTPAGVKASEKERYLSTGDFEAALGMDAVAFGAMPKWKRNTAKQKAKIY